MNRETHILNIINNPDIDSYCKKLASNDWEDLKHELILQLYDIPMENFKEYIKGGILFYVSLSILKIILNKGKDDVGLFSRNDRIFNNIDNEFLDENIKNSIKETPQGIDSPYFDVDKVYDCIECLDIYDKTIFNKYHKEDLNLREISEFFDIKIGSVYYMLRKAQNKIKECYDRDN